eukprot:6079446-Lingulodinium_polyedra.AAC.1
MQDDEIATLRVYVTDAAKRAVVIKYDDILTKRELHEHAEDVPSSRYRNKYMATQQLLCEVRS